MRHEVVEYRAALQRPLAQLHADLGNGDVATSARYLRWKYTQRRDRARACVAVQAGAIVGARGATGQPWRRGASRALLWSTSDPLIHPDRPRRHNLAVAITARLVGSFGAPTPPFINLSARSRGEDTEKDGWRVLGSWSVARQGMAMLHVSSGGGTAGSRAPFAVLDECAGTWRGLPDGISVSRTPRDVAMARFTERFPLDGLIRPVRDAAFYSWRYCNPRSEYRFLFLTNRGLRGFLTLQSARSGACVGVNVVEWEALTSRDKALLLEAALGFGDFDRFSVWSSSFTSDERDILNKLGFDWPAGDDEPPRILVRPGSASLRLDVDDFSSWRIPAAASEMF